LISNDLYIKQIVGEISEHLVLVCIDCKKGKSSLDKI